MNSDGFELGRIREVTSLARFGLSMRRLMRAGRRALARFDGVMFRNHYFFWSARLGLSPKRATALIRSHYNHFDTQGKGNVFRHKAENRAP